MSKTRNLLNKVKDTVLAENAFTGGNINDIANLAYRVNESGPDNVANFCSENLEDGQKYKVVISTESDDEHADAVYKADGGFYANFYKS